MDAGVHLKAPSACNTGPESVAHINAQFVQLFLFRFGASISSSTLWYSLLSS
jgi:hypothetical protein